MIVLDSPELEEGFLSLTADLNGLYGLPMRGGLGQNSGFAYANNAGVEHATGERLLFLNSDVFPERQAGSERCWRPTTRTAAPRRPARS